MTNDSPWRTVTEAADYARRHYDTVWTALRTGELRGHQRKPGAPWAIHCDDLDAWIRGEDPAPAAPKRVTRASA